MVWSNIGKRNFVLYLLVPLTLRQLNTLICSQILELSHVMWLVPFSSTYCTSENWPIDFKILNVLTKTSEHDVRS